MFISSDLIIKFIEQYIFCFGKRPPSKSVKTYGKLFVNGQKRLIFANNKGLKEVIKIAYAIYPSFLSYTLCSFQSKESAAVTATGI